MKIDFTHVPTLALVEALDQETHMVEFELRAMPTTNARALMLLDEIRQGLQELKKRNSQ